MSRFGGTYARLLIGLAVTGVVVLVLGAAMEGTLVYARTPATIGASRAGDQVRVSGVVVPGSLRVDEGSTTFQLAGGGKQIPVVSRQAPPGTFREGQQAVVEGLLGDDGVFVADRVIAQHGNVYRASSGS